MYNLQKHQDSFKEKTLNLLKSYNLFTSDLNKLFGLEWNTHLESIINTLFDDNNTIINQIYEKVIENINNIQKVLQKSTMIVTKQSNTNVIDDLKKILFGDQEVLIKDLPGMQTQAAEIPHIVDLIPNRYTVTDKADGERTFMFINNGSIFLISNTLEFKQLDPKEMALTKIKVEEFNNTILDGEYIFVGSKQKFKRTKP